MTLRLGVDTGAWRAHVESTSRTLGELIPVVKGNGYGFGRTVLMAHAAALSSEVAVGTVHELPDVPPSLQPYVLTPLGAGILDGDAKVTGALASRSDAVLTIGSSHDVDVLTALGSTHRVVIKVESSVHRYGVPPSNAAELRAKAESAGLEVTAWSVHLPLTGSDAERVPEATAIAGALSTDLPLHVSHVGGAAEHVRKNVRHRVVMRAGTYLWLGDKSMLALRADVIAVRSTTATTAGYRASRVPDGANLVMVGCGSSHGVAALDDGRSPFHYGKRRLAMLEAPHMHTTMLAVSDEPCPHEGDWVDVQQPLTRVHPDVIVWG